MHAVSKLDSVVDAISLYFGVTVSVTLGNCCCVATALVDIVLPDVPDSDLASEVSGIAPVTFDSFWLSRTSTLMFSSSLKSSLLLMQKLQENLFIKEKRQSRRNAQSKIKSVI